MASKFLCECGYTVFTNLFEGHGIYRMVIDNDIDRFEDADSAEAVKDLWFKSQEAIKCKGCGCLYLWNSATKQYDQYKKVEHGHAT